MIEIGARDLTVGLDEKTGCIASLRASVAPAQEFIQELAGVPALVVHYLDRGSFHELSSLEAKSCTADREGSSVAFRFTGVKRTE